MGVNTYNYSTQETGTRELQVQDQCGQYGKPLSQKSPAQNLAYIILPCHPQVLWQLKRGHTRKEQWGSSAIFLQLWHKVTGTAATRRVCGATGNLDQNVPRKSPQLPRVHSTGFRLNTWSQAVGIVWEGCGDFLEEMSHKGWALRFFGLKELSTHSASHM